MQRFAAIGGETRQGCTDSSQHPLFPHSNVALAGYGLQESFHARCRRGDYGSIGPLLLRRNQKGETIEAPQRGLAVTVETSTILSVGGPALPSHNRVIFSCASIGNHRRRNHRANQPFPPGAGQSWQEDRSVRLRWGRGVANCELFAGRSISKEAGAGQPRLRPPMSLRPAGVGGSFIPSPAKPLPAGGRQSRPGPYHRGCAPAKARRTGPLNPHRPRHSRPAVRSARPTAPGPASTRPPASAGCCRRRSERSPS